MPRDVATETHSHADLTAGPVRRIELLPNCSLTPDEACRFFALCALGSLSVALLFVANGYWPVLPFAGLELALLAYALRASLQRRHHLQTVEIGETDITVTTRDLHGERASQFSRHWARVTLRDPRGRQPGRLSIESHGRSCEIGAFLTEDARRALGRRLTALVANARGRPAPGAAGRNGSRDRGDE